MKTDQGNSQQKILYSKALQGSSPQSNLGPISSSSNLTSNMSGNSSNISGSHFNHKGQGNAHFHAGNGSRILGLNSPNMRNVGKNGQPASSYSNRHNQVLLSLMTMMI